MINPVLGGKIRQGMMVKGMLDLAGDISLEDLTMGGITGDTTGLSTALYKDVVLHRCSWRKDNGCQR